MDNSIDLKRALNAVSDVIQNRPRPIREFDQIHMKAGDMVMQSEFVARWADGKRLAFIGDGDAISVCVAYLKSEGIIDFGPSMIIVYDFDERIVESIKMFSDKLRVDTLGAQLANVFDPLPSDRPNFDCYYTNPPWGQYNRGSSVNLFSLRGMEAIRYSGDGLIVIADDNNLDWPPEVMSSAQRFASDRGFYVARMMQRLHAYHLDDAPELRSCNLLLRSLPHNPVKPDQPAVTDPSVLHNFYGRGERRLVRYIRARERVDHGRAHESEYTIEYVEDGGGDAG